MEGGLLDSGQGEEREQKPSAAAAGQNHTFQGEEQVVKMIQKPSAAAAAGARELQAGGSYSLGSGEEVEQMKMLTKKVDKAKQMVEKEPKTSAAAGARELQAGGSYSLGSGEGEEPEKWIQIPSAAAAAGATSAFLVLTIAYAFLVIYVTETYTHSWMEKLQMLPLCIVAVIPPMLWAIMFRQMMLALCIVAVTPPILWAIMFGKFHG